ncbi:SH3 domain-containing protein [Desulfonema magnum]|uniref:SH3 domain-containing protein n=1 Tax=Desulfonema magnum TaxID=45655 RepID=UPI001FE64092|nr:SH3 domain-containing protein [Desulfonema magnum]
MKSYSFIIAILVIMFAGVASAQRMTVNVSMANIRSGPGTNYDVLWKVEKYHPIHVIKKSGSWYQFRDFEGDKGWISKDLVRNFASVIVIKNKCNVRSGPGVGNKIVMTVEKGVPFKETERKGEWVRIRHSDGEKGWIHKALVW